MTAETMRLATHSDLAYNTFASFQINIIFIFIGLVCDKKDLYLQIAFHIFTFVFSKFSLNHPLGRLCL